MIQPKKQPKGVCARHFALVLVVPLAVACKEKIGPQDRVVRLRGLPACAAGMAYKRQVVAQFKPSAGKSETAFEASMAFSTPVRDDFGLHVPTTGFTRTLQVGLCDPTPVKGGGLSTECSTPVTPVFERTLTFPAGRDLIEVDVGAVVDCGPWGSAKVQSWAKE